MYVGFIDLDIYLFMLFVSYEFIICFSCAVLTFVI